MKRFLPLSDAFPACENISLCAVERLRATGFDVTAVRAASPGASDGDVHARAQRDGRILITEDRDFGELAIRQRLEIQRVVLLELDRLSNAAEADRVAAVISGNADKLPENVLAIEPGRVRIRPLRR